MSNDDLDSLLEALGGGGEDDDQVGVGGKSVKTTAEDNPANSVLATAQLQFRGWKARRDEVCEGR